MSIIYLDTSVLIKRYIREQGSEALSAHWPSFSIVGSAVIIYVEIAAALAKAERLGWLDAEVAQNAWGAFLNDWGKLSLININKAVLNRASDLAWEYGLRGYDAVHLGAALVWQEGLREMVQLCTFDRQLWNAAKQVSMSVWPDDLDPFFG
jgi:predicted nucleic acid-binding protein